MMRRGQPLQNEHATPLAAHDPWGVNLAMSAVSDSRQDPDAGNSEYKKDHPERLQGKSIMLVEDEGMIAMEIEFELEGSGAKVVGPISRLDEALEKKPFNGIDAAILDVNLNGEVVFPLAEILVQEEIPFVFHTGNASSHEIQQQFPATPIVKKPSNLQDLMQSLSVLL